MSQSGTLLRGTASHTTGAGKFGTNGLAAGVYQFPAYADSHLSLTGFSGGSIGVPSAKFGSGGLSSGVYNFVAAVDSWISSTGADGGNLSGAGTVEAWVKTTATDRRVAAGHQGWYWLGIDSGGYPMARFGPPGSEITLLGTTPINDGVMHHIALTRDATMRLHVDGNQVASNGTPKIAGTSVGSFTVGGLGNVTTVDWAGAGGGTIDEVRVSNVARYTGATYTIPTDAFTTDANTTLLLHLDGDLADSSGNSRAATLVRSGNAVAGNGTATIEAWVKTSATSTRVAVGHDSVFWIGIRFDGLPRARYGTANDEVSLDGSVAINDGNWHHLALVLGEGASNRFYVDGTLVASSAVPKTYAANGSSARLCIGGFSSSSSADWAGDGSGVIDEVRVSKNGRYSGSSFTVPTNTFAGDSNTVLLAHLESDGTDSSGQTFGVRVEPNDSNLVYSPYNWKVVAGLAQTINPGAYLRMLLGGSPTSINLEFDLSNIAAPFPVLAYSVDGSGFQRIALAASITIPIPTNNTWPAHAITLVVDAATETQNRWNTPSATAVKLTGISVGGASVVTKPVGRRALTAIIFGDSITEGVRALQATAASGLDVDRNQASVGWAYRQAEALGAEVGVVGFGRQGMTQPGNGNVPACQTAYASLWQGESRDFATTPPDLVLVNHGTNDLGLSVSTATFKAGYIAFLNAILAATPRTTRIGVMLPFNGAYGITAFQEIVAGCNTPTRVRFINTTGWYSGSDSSDTTHPYGYTSTMRLAPLLAAASRDIIKRASYIRVSGSWVPTSRIV